MRWCNRNAMKCQVLILRENLVIFGSISNLSCKIRCYYPLLHAARTLWDGQVSDSTLFAKE